jgi:hypothetical protein
MSVLTFPNVEAKNCFVLHLRARAIAVCEAYVFRPF